MIDIGSGPAVVLVPGIQGRWEWMRPTVNALAAHYRVITSSLPGEPGSGPFFGGFNEYTAHVDRLLDMAQLSSAVVCGISFGGLIALRYAATRHTRTRALILVSTPGPHWKPAAYQARYLRRPILTSPLFVAGAAGRTWRELRFTLPDLRTRLAFCGTWAKDVLTAPGIPGRMGVRGRLAAGEDFRSDCSHITVPTLVIAGEPELDRVVSVDDTLTYVRLIPGAEFRVLARTGHLGTVSAPERFASIVATFVKQLPIEHD